MAQFTPAYGYYDVTAPAYGAPNDGVHDAAAGIILAEADAEATGGVVYFPPGKYLLKTSGVAINKSNITWQGAGAGISQILLDASLGTTTTMVAIGGGLSNIILRDLSFLGNNQNNGSGAPGNDAITFGTNGGGTNVFCKVQRCKFYQTTAGATIRFWNTTDGEVSSCNFTICGHNNSNNNDSNVTPGVLIEQSCINVRVLHSYFNACKYDGVRIRGSACEVSYNYFYQCVGNAAIDVGVQGGSVSGARILANYIDSTDLVQANNQGINLLNVTDFQLIGNTVTATKGYGIAAYGCADGVVIGNVCFDNHQSSAAGNAGIYYEGQAGTNLNKAISFVGNVSYDSGVGKQTYGMAFADTSAAASDFVLAGNTFWGNTSAQISIDSAILSNNSNVAIANTSWSDRIHETSQTNTQSIIGPLVPANPQIDAYSMRTTNGLRIVAAGRTTNGMAPGSKSFSLGLGTAGNIMPTQLIPAPSGTVDWQIIAYVMNDGAFNAQKATVQFYYNGSVVYHASPTLGVGTDTAQSVLLEGAIVPGSGDTILTHFLSVERL